MNEELSPKMIDAIKHMARHGNVMVRYPGGYWASKEWHMWHGPSFGTPTIEGIVRRGYAEYSVWKDGRSSKFPIECALTQRAADVAVCSCNLEEWVTEVVDGVCSHCKLPRR